MKLFNTARIIGIIILIILIGISWLWSGGHLSANLTNSGISFIWFVGLLGLNIVINHEWIEDPLILEDKLLQYPRYKLLIVGVGVIAIMRYLDNPFTKLTASFALSNIIFGRDHRWSAFLALDMLTIVIVMLILNEQSIADSAAIYLYYFLVIATLTMIVHRKESSEEERKESNN